MGTSLTGLTPATTYDALIKVGDNGPITGTLKVLSDGLGNNLPMEASSTTINFTNGLQQSGVAVPTASQVNAKQDTLVSGTNIKTINGTSVLGAGNIVTPTTSPSGVSGAIQFSNGSAFASDASNFFWDNTNKRLGIGTNAPTQTLDIVSTSISQLRLYNSSNAVRFTLDGSAYGNIVNNSGQLYIDTIAASTKVILRGADGAEIQKGATIKGSGSTSATTSLLVQNSSGTQLMKIADDNGVVFGTVASSVNRARFGTYLQLKYDSPSIDVWQGGSGVGLEITNAGALLAAFNDVNFGSIIRYSLIVGSASYASASAQLQVDSTTKGFLPPRMTTTQKNAIASPAAGLVVYDNTTNKLCCYNGSTWNDLF